MDISNGCLAASYFIVCKLCIRQCMATWVHGIKYNVSNLLIVIKVTEGNNMSVLNINERPHWHIDFVIKMNVFHLNQGSGSRARSSFYLLYWAVVLPHSCCHLWRLVSWNSQCERQRDGEWWGGGEISPVVESRMVQVLLLSRDEWLIEGVRRLCCLLKNVRLRGFADFLEAFLVLLSLECVMFSWKVELIDGPLSFYYYYYYIIYISKYNHIIATLF